MNYYSMVDRILQEISLHRKEKLRKKEGSVTYVNLR
jgi:hypothetical protein